MTTFGCPNTPPCAHPSYIHDVYDMDDLYPTCCVEGCRCGHPGEAVVQRHDDGTVTVLQADHLIKVSKTLLNSPDLEPWVKQGDIIQLDTAGHYRYRYLRPLRDGVLVYERIT